ncbi:MAG: glycoside hydrolase family 43 protein [Bryobacteraceae bacterium]|nr:glycoside hydrolase family 43 protein [Bryobacteraceae bacterium]
MISALTFFLTMFAESVSNPILPSGPDPFISVHNGMYYITQTTGRDIRIRKASTLAGLALSEPTQVWIDPDPARCCNIWAPEFHRLPAPDGHRWYLYYTAGPRTCCAQQRMHVLESEADDPLGPYRYKARLYDAAHDYWAIDPTVFPDGNGRLHVVYSGTPQDRMPHEKPQNLYIAALENPWTMRGERVLLSEPTLDWERRGGGVNEGPAVLRRGGTVFLAFSGSGCYTDDYAVGLLEASASSNLLDPASWKKHAAPWLSRNDEAGVFAPGHNSFFRPPGSNEDWIVYHANARPGLGCGGARSPRVQPIRWSPSGQPLVERPTAGRVMLP